MRIYLDAAPVIYLIEQVEPHAAAVDAWMSRPDAVFVASELTRFECIVKPLRQRDKELMRDYEEFFAARVAEWVPLDRTVFQRAAEIRAEKNFRTPDALHLAVAVASKCDAVLTHDSDWARFTDVNVTVL